MAAKPTFDQNLTGDGFTVWLQRAGGKLTVEVTDPAGAVSELEVVDVFIRQPVTTMVGLESRAHSQDIFAPMFKALDTITQATADAIREGQATLSFAAPAQSALYRDVSAVGHSLLWGPIKAQRRETCEHLNLDELYTLCAFILAGTLRELIGHDGFPAAEYDTMTHPWRIFVVSIPFGVAHVASELVDEPVAV